MEDSTAKTIDFLRARLLAERSVSRTARQRANELAKRVTELEKQLKFVSLQRKKAEKATVDVLAILENHGRSDFSEPFDSSSDQEETSSDFKNGKIHVEETSEHAKVRESDTEGFSGSEAESSSVNGRSLSWKSSKKSSSRFLDKKYMDASRRRRNSLTSTGSSPRRVGKSCRQIRHKEHRSVDDDVSQNGDATNGHREDEGRTSSEGICNSADVATETSQNELNIQEEKKPVVGTTSLCNGHSIQNHGTERDMERALKHQAQFIAQYEEEEKAQKEWEDKFRENNGTTPDLCDPGTHSDVTEEREEPKPPKPVSENQENDTVIADANFNEQPKIDMKTEPLDKQNDPPELEQTQENPAKLESVLEALQQAKLSLKQNLVKFPLLENGPSVPTYRPADKFPVPFSSVGLFRLPTDYEYGETTTKLTTRANSFSYDPRLSLTNYPTDSSPYRESSSRSVASVDDRFRMVPTFPYQETIPEIPKLPLAAFNPRLGMGQSAVDPRLGVRQSVFDSRFDVGMGLSAPDPRFDVGTRPSAHDPRLGIGPSTIDPRLGIGPSTIDPRLGIGPSTIDPRMGVGPSSFDQQMGVGPSTLGPGFETGPQFTGDRYTSSAGLPPYNRYGSLPNVDIPLRTRSVYDDSSRTTYSG